LVVAAISIIRAEQSVFLYHLPTVAKVLMVRFSSINRPEQELNTASSMVMSFYPLPCEAPRHSLLPWRRFILQTVSALDCLVHWIAFCSPRVQLAAAELERLAFSAAYENVETGPPVFVTSMPRAGTTILLEALHRFPSLATQLYRDMPFVMSPVLWSKLSGAFRVPATMQERAHGDKLQIGYDSPESFEEVLWRAFWPEKYGNASIGPWGAADFKEDAWEFISEHMKKIVALRSPNRAMAGRYLAKNNANIARLDLLEKMFPDASIVLPIRHPVQHVRALHRQHYNF
jgi:hypothetical protein